jgi:hypothetical protein
MKSEEECGIYLDHELRIRVHEERFNDVENSIQNLDNKMNLIIAVVTASIVLLVLGHFGLI